MTSHRALDKMARHLETLQSIVSEIYRVKQKAFTRNGKLQNQLVDQDQIFLFTLANISTLLEAAQQMRYYGEEGTSLQQGLAAFFLAESIQKVLVELQFASLPSTPQRELECLVLEADLQHLLVSFQSPQEIASLATPLLEGDFGYPKLSEEHKICKETFEKYGREKIAPLAEKIHREDLLVPEDLIAELASMGCFGLTIPEQYGGSMGEKPDNLGMVVITEELSRASLGAAGSLITRPEIMAKALLKGGTEDQKKKWLPQIASGEKMVAVAVTEPDFGSDVASLSCQALPCKEGYRIQGVKTWCTFAGRADLLLLLARTDPDLSRKHRGLSLFVVEKERSSNAHFSFTQPSGGKITGRAIPTIGYRGMHSYEVVFENYEVPEENLIGGSEGLGRGFYLQMEGFAGGRLQTAARACGVMQAALDAAVRYGNERKVFGKPIASYPLTQYKIVKMAACLQAARLLSFHAARLANESKGQLESSMAKLFASRQAEWVTREAQQIHGGMGYAEEYAVSRYFVDARVFSIFEGAEEILALRVIARQLLEKS